MHCRADLLVEARSRSGFLRGQRFVAEVKTGERAIDPTHPATRRQLMEYLHVFEVDGVLLVDREAGVHSANCLRFEARADQGTLDGFVGDEREPLDASPSPVLWGFLAASAAIMVVGVVNLFGSEGFAAAAAATSNRTMSGDKQPQSLITSSPSCWLIWT